MLRDGFRAHRGRRGWRIDSRPAKRISWQAAKMDSSLEGRIDEAVARSLEDGQMAGCVVLIGRRAGIVFEKAYGNRSVEPQTEPMTTDTLFDMASLTKPVATATSRDDPRRARATAAAGQGGEVLSRVRREGEAGCDGRAVAGAFVGADSRQSARRLCDGWESAKPKICDLEPLSEPGTKFKYSDVNFILLGKIVEAVAGKPENEFAKREICDKLGMHDTGYLPSDELKARAETTEKSDGKWLKGEVHDPRAAKMGGVAGHAGLFSTAEDMAIYATMMLQKGAYGGVRSFQPGDDCGNDAARDIGGHQRGAGLG